MNRKVINAGGLVYNGVKYRSKLEVSVCKELERQGLQFLYEPEKIILQEGFKSVNPYYIDSVEHWEKTRAITYTPDFVATIGKYTVYMEVKGWATDRYVIKKKMFLNAIKDNHNSIFIEVHTIRGLKNSILKIKSLCLE